MVVERLINWEPLTQAYKSLNLKWKILATISVLAIILEFLYFVCCVIPWAKMGVAEWAYWVGAIGTILAVCGAIWIANRDSAIRRRDAMTIAILVASTSQSKVQQLGQIIDDAIKHLSEFDDDWLHERFLKLAKDVLRHRPSLSTETIAQLTPLNGSCALKFAQVQNAITNVCVALDKVKPYKLENAYSDHFGSIGVTKMIVDPEVHVLTHQRKKLWEVQEILRTAGK